jgi:hypothetical protein
MEETQTSFDIMVNGKKVGETFDFNPIVIETDDSCREFFLDIKENLPLSESEIELIDGCMEVLLANIDDDVLFGPKEILELESLAEKYPSHTSKILACSHYLMESVDCDGEIPQGIFAELARAHGALGDLFFKGLKAGDALGYSDEEEEITDDEEENNA